MTKQKTELQKKFEEQTPTIKGMGRVEYLQTFITWLHLQVERCEGKKLPTHNVNGSLPSLDDATKVAVRISEEAIKPPLDAKEQAMFIAGFQECIKWLNVVFSNER